MTVDAGTVITVKNLDGVQHSVTSEAQQGDYTPGAVGGVSFDTGLLAAGASGSVTIPATAPSGTVIPYYCSKHTSMMGQGTITVH
jgi:plastocyanin